MPFPYQPYRTIPRPRNTKFLALTGVSIYPLSLPMSRQVIIADMGFTPAYGSFSSGTTQTILAGPPIPITYDRTDIASRISLVGSLPTDRIEVQDTGIYRLIYSAQLEYSGGAGSTGDMTIFPAINGFPVANSATYTSIPHNEEIVITCEVLMSLNAGDVVIVFAFTNTGNVVIPAIPGAGGIPDAPSIITILQRIA